MTFLDALKIGRPMRRKSGSDYKPPWLTLGTETLWPHAARWRLIDTGETTGLRACDYLATDWEVMP